MTSRLSSDTMVQLTPLLGSISRLIAGDSHLSEDELGILLLGADLESDLDALQELKRWSRLLALLRQQPSEQQRRITVEALRLRGLPEATILLAVSAVTDDVPAKAMLPASSQQEKLSSSIDSLDFGMLTNDTPAVTEFDVWGGPGQIVIESDQIQVTPQQFDSGKTRIKVAVKPLVAGLLWTTLKLVTAGETLEVPVMAQWQDSSTNVERSQQTNDTESDITAMLEQALGIHTTEGDNQTIVNPSALPTPQPIDPGEAELMEQLEQLLGRKE